MMFSQPTMQAASVSATQQAINQACKSRGGHYAQYSCKTVSWDDANRGTFGGGLSCWGSNITDTYLKAKSGTSLFTVRSDNWNEKLGAVTADEVALVAGNHMPDGALSPITLRDFLKNAGVFGSYANLKPADDLSSALDEKISIRFQTTFLPVEDKHQAALEFATEAYNYNTHSDTDPKNLVLLCTTQGVAVQQDGKGTKKLFHHNVGHDGSVSRHWLEAERSRHAVGQAQTETAAERADAVARGKATSSVIGIKALGTRFNVLMTVQIPLEQKEKPRYRGGGGFGGGGVVGGIGFGGSFGMSAGAEMESLATTGFALHTLSLDAPVARGLPTGAKAKVKKRVGKANAARVSRGSKVDNWGGLTVTNPKRHPNEHITVTCVIYNTVAGGVPSAEDVCAAIDDMENLYAACSVSGKLGSNAFNFMKSELTTQDMIDVTTTPGVQNFGAFPTSATTAPPVAPVPPVPIPVPVPTPPATGGTVHFNPATPAPSTLVHQAATLPLTHESFLYIHDQFALKWLNAQDTPTSLIDAFHTFRLANELHTQVHGVPNGACTYNIACCLSVAAEKSLPQAARMIGIPAPSTPPGTQPRALDAALVYLRAAVVSGYRDSLHMSQDPDLAALRQHRPSQLQWAIEVSRLNLN